MREVDRLKEELARAILASDEYKEYKRCEQAVRRNVDLYRFVNVMRRQNFELQNNEDVYNMFEETEHLQNQYGPLSSQAEVKAFLLAEVSLGRLIREIYEALVRGLEFDIDFLKG